MKKLEKLLFVFFINFVFVSNINAADFYCGLGEYTLGYNSDGKLISAEKDGKLSTKNLESYFHPTNVSECPNTSEAKITIIDGGRTVYVAQITENIGYEPSTEPTLSEEEQEKKQDLGGCNGYTYESSCEHNDYYSCIWNKSEYGDYCNTDKLQYVQCGDAFDIPHEVPSLISFLVNLLKIATPIILIMVSIISLLKALAASSEDEIKKAQKSLTRKIIAAVMVFFVISIVQYIVMLVADNTTKSSVNGKVETDNISNCLSCFLNNDCGANAYYKTSVGGQYKCTYFSDMDHPVNCD